MDQHDTMPPWAYEMEQRFHRRLEDLGAELKAAIVGAREQMADAYQDAVTRVARVESLRPEHTTGEHQPIRNGSDGQ